ncbi:MAG TPA: hypothetical protein VFB38_06780 [Chthonomonadaceae bacterium]|nr:hypothetical protein [Chthonomonadaceae bacterium]
MDRILQGRADAKKEAIQIGRRFGADILVTGEAFTQEATRRMVDTDLGRLERVQCRGRLELKAIRVDTGEKIYSDALHKTGSPDATEELASKICLQQLGEEISEGLMRKLDKLALSPTRHIELEVRGIGSVSLANALEKALSKLEGVQEINPGDYNARIYETEVLLSTLSLRDFAARLETAPSLRRFHLHVQSASGSKIIADSH